MTSKHPKKSEVDLPRGTTTVADRKPRSTRLQLATVAWIGALCAGVATAMVFEPSLFRWLDGSGRIETLHGAVTEPTPLVEPGSGAFLGNSITMNGIDTGRIREDLGMSPPFLNLSSGGQHLWESALLFENLPPQCKTICIGISPDQVFGGSKTGPAESVLTKYWMSGFTPSRSYLDWAKKMGAENIVEFFDLTSVGKLVASRWVVTNFINTGLRTVMRKDLDLKRSRENLLHPAPYTKRLSEDKLQRMLPATYEPLFGDGIDEEKVDWACNVLRFTAETAKSKNQSVYFVLLPIHPYARKLLGPDYSTLITDKLGEFVDERCIVNLSDRLPEERFIDQCHPDAEGARLISSEIAAFLKRNMNPSTENN